MIEETLERLFADVVTPALIEELEAGKWPADLWSEIENLGLTMALAPEEAGGSDMPWGDAYGIFKSAGRHAIPVPLVETMVAVDLLARSGISIPPGPMSLHDRGKGDQLKLKRQGDIWLLDGVAHGVPWGRMVDHIVLIVAYSEELQVVLAPVGDCFLVPGENLAGEPRDEIHFSGCQVTAASPANQAMADTRAFAALARAAQLAGAFEAILTETILHISERKQFGRPLTKFQAVQQNLALLASEIAAAGVAAEAAFIAAESGDFSFDVAVAKVRASAAVGPVTSIAHQLLGAMGFTREHKLQLLTRRAWSWRGEFGGEREWACVIGGQVVGQGPEGTWDTLTNR